LCLRRVRKRAHMVLLSDMGYNLKEIARIVIVSPHTAATQVHAYEEEEGIQALHDEDIPGRPPSLDKEEKDQVDEWLEGSPREEGYNQSNWTMRLLAYHVNKEFGVDLSEERVREIAHDLGFRPLKPRYKLEEADREAKEKARERVSDWVEEAKGREDLVLLAEDEMKAQLRPTLRWMWAKKGRQPRIPTEDEHGRRTVFGASNPLTGRTHYHVGEGRTKEEFLSLLRQLDRFYPSEKKLVLLLDNASAHKAKEVEEYLRKTKRITLAFLPPYCPDLNPIERLWKGVRKKVTHNYPFATMEEMIEAVRDAFRYFASARKRVVSLLGVA